MQTEKDEVKLILGDCLEIMKTIPDKSIDLVLTDPPYGITDCIWDIIKDFMGDLIRVSNEKTSILVFSRNPYTADLIYKNKVIYKHSWVWNKKISGGFATAKYRPLQITEDINVFCKTSPNYYPIMTPQKKRKAGGCKKVNQIQSGLKVGYSYYRDTKYPTNILEFGNTNRRNSLHPTQKPLELIKYLIKTYSKENDIVLDPFMGSGTTGVACKELGRRFIGIEINEKYFEIAKRRINQTMENLL